MNNAFGAQFTSRLNLNLREDKGYTYGAGSQFTDNKGMGTFYSYAAVEASTTDESITEIIKEMKDLLSARPLTETEIADSKNNLIRSFPQAFQTYDGITGLLSNQVIFGLPANNWYTYVNRVNAITAVSATQSAKDHLHPDALVIVVVGDKKTIASGIRALNLGEITFIQSK
jgi:zinc protease